MADQYRINGNMHSWASIICRVGIERITGITSIDYGDKRERVKGYGMGRSHAPRGRTSGKYTPDPVKIKGPKSTIEAIRAQLALLSPDQRSYGNSEFDIQLQYIEALDTPMNVVIRRCVVSEDHSGHEENPDPLMDELTLDCMYIIRNGKTLYDSTKGL